MFKVFGSGRNARPAVVLNPAAARKSSPGVDRRILETVDSEDIGSLCIAGTWLRE